MTKQQAELSEKELMDIVDDADCNAETCFVTGGHQYALLGWAKRLIRVSFEAGREFERSAFIHKESKKGG